MKHRASKVVALLVVMAAVSGCKLLKKKQAEFDSTLSPTPSTPLSADQEPDAVNRSQILRFPDETLLHGVPAFVRQFTLARTMPNEGGVSVSAIPADTLVQKFAERQGFTLVAFDRPGVPGKHAGWISNVAFIPPGTVAAATTPAFPTATTPTPTAVPTPSVRTAFNTPPIPTPVPTPPPPPSSLGVKPTTGTCKLELRVSGFVGSNPGCSFNEKVRSGSPTTITFPCAGGTTSAKFGNQVFTGAVTGTGSSQRVSLTQIETFPFESCQFRSIQSITGTPPNLQYSYAENVVSGSCKASSTCTAKAVITAL
jgi:hypothetical protein